MKTRLVRWIACGAAIALFVRSLAHADLTRTWAILGHAGPLVVLCFLPYLAALTVDSLAWKHVFAALGRDPKHQKLLLVRLACEAVSMSLPAGAVFAESLTPTLLERHTGTSPSTSVAAMAGKKWLTMRSHGIYVLISAVVGFGILSRISNDVIGSAGLPWLVMALACIPAGLSVGLETSLARGSLAERLHGLLGRIPVARLKRWLENQRTGFARTDSGFARLVSDRTRSTHATFLYVAAWLIESLETLVILRVLGASVGFAEAMSIEAGLSVVRSLAFFAPSGIGVQDVGYVACFSAMGLPEAGALGAAFVLVKRSKELFWIGVGYAALLASGRKARESTPPVAVAPASLRA